MANLRDIRNRIESIQNTQQITKAMKMVAAAKLRKAQNRIIETRPYAFKMREVVARLVENSDPQSNVLLRRPESVDRVLFIVVGSDRGLCGAFNNQLFKSVQKRIDSEFIDYLETDTLDLVTIGRKPTNHFGKRRYNVVDGYDGFFDELYYGKASDLMKGIIPEFVKGKYDAVYLAYNEFKSVLTQNRLIEKILPIEPEQLIKGQKQKEALRKEVDYLYEPSITGILEELLPQHLNMQLWKAILESNAAEQGARMTAMDNATENAKELERDLRLEYNQARQTAITTEISEIVSGAAALEED